jgi:hypothetical protein
VCVCVCSIIEVGPGKGQNSICAVVHIHIGSHCRHCIVLSIVHVLILYMYIHDASLFNGHFP